MLWQHRDLTPSIDSEEEIEEARILESRARKELEDDGCPPCYPPNLDFPLRNPPEKYQAIIQYWKSVDDVVLCYQKLDWEKFRRLQAIVRRRNRPFKNFVDEVRERRQRYGLSGHVRLLLNTEQQSQLENWMEFQNRHLKRLEQFEKERDKLKQELEDNQKLAGDRNTPRPKLGPTRAEALKRRLKVIERDLKWHHVLLHWIEQRRLAMDLGHPTPVKEDHEDQDAAPKAVRRTFIRECLIKQVEGPSILGKFRVTKANLKKRNIRNMPIQRPKAPELEPPIWNLNVIPQSSASQASKHPETKPRHTKIDGPLRQIRPQRVTKANRYAGIRVKSSSSSQDRGAELTQTPDRKRRPTQHAQSACIFTTRSGRISRPPTR